MSRTSRAPVPRSPVKVLDAPGLLDDFYLQLLDWGIAEDAVAAALGSVVYLWKASTASVQELCDAGSSKQVTALKWRPPAGASHGSATAGGSSRLAVGLSDGSIQLWDPERKKKLRSLLGHRGRVACADWASEGSGHGLLATGAADGRVMLRDVRSPK